MTRNAIHFAAITALLSMALFTGCQSKEQDAVEQAKKQAASTGIAQQVQYVDQNGDTVTTTVQPPAAGQAQQVSTKHHAASPGSQARSHQPGRHTIRRPRPASANFIRASINDRP